ncbi:hypothetical protein QZH41_006093 [Actinostola sp. cb2023]|nr:hypothetical protein QZH41_006093 [Actinostola sp. cb2023]
MITQIFEEAGLPAGILNFVPCSGPVFGKSITTSPDLAAINFTGSVGTFKTLWQYVANNLDVYKTYPRLIGECGGKNYHFIHNTADVNRVVQCTIRASFGYQGQKCSACSRMYVPESLWPQIKEGLLEEHKKIKMGSPADIENTFVTAVIDEKSFDNIKSYIDFCNDSNEVTVLAGGQCDKRLTKQPNLDLQEPYSERTTEASVILRESAGNFYINDKCTGSVVQQQPFGGARLSGQYSPVPQVSRHGYRPLYHRYPDTDTPVPQVSRHGYLCTTAQ